MTTTTMMTMMLLLLTLSTTTAAAIQNPACSICGSEEEMTNPSEYFFNSYVGRLTTCAESEQLGAEGAYTSLDCILIQDNWADHCGCQAIAQETTVAPTAPTTTTTLAPTPAENVPAPTPVVITAPTSSPSPPPVEETTSAPTPDASVSLFVYQNPACRGSPVRTLTFPTRLLPGSECYHDALMRIYSVSDQYCNQETGNFHQTVYPGSKDCTSGFFLRRPKDLVYAPDECVNGVQLKSCTFASSSSLSTVNKRGVLYCGVQERPFEATLNPQTGQFEGFSVDMCRAIAAAVFGNDYSLQIKLVNPSNRFQVLQNLEVDLLVAGVTHTMERDVYEPTTKRGFHFSTPYYYDGLGFGGQPSFVDCADDLDGSTNHCVNLTICTVVSSTHEIFLKSHFNETQIVRCVDDRERVGRFQSGECNVLAGESTEIAEVVIQSYGYTGLYSLGENIFTREPICLVTRDDDGMWSDMVEWILQALLTAEEQGIGQANYGDFITTNIFGSQYSRLFQNALQIVGNYGEIYERNLQVDVPRSGPNMLNFGETGLIYPMPFGDSEVVGPVSETGTLQDIRNRGYLRCGVFQRDSFAKYVSGQWRGLEVDFCKAISAAIFDGSTADIVFEECFSSGELFTKLNSSAVDVLIGMTTVTFEQDVKEPTTGQGFSFSQPYFYDGLLFGGIPPYGACADNLDWSSEACRDLSICVNENTIFFDELQWLFPSYVMVPLPSDLAVGNGLASQTCNAIAGGAIDVSKRNVQRLGGYFGSYETGTNTFSKDPLALVTRQEDEEWSSFCNWVVSSVFHAEELGINAATAGQDMPVVNLFGEDFSDMVRNAVSAVGSFEEILKRHFDNDRSALNQLNDIPCGPQHYAFPGL